MGTSKIQLLFFPPFVQGEGDEEAPGSKTGKVNDKVEVPFIVRGMLGNRGSEHIVHTDEVQKEIFAVEIAHGAVPGAGYQDEKDKAGKEVHMGHFLQVFFIEEKEQARKPGKEDADGALGEGGQGGKEIAEEIVFPVFRIPQIEESHGAAHEKE